MDKIYIIEDDENIRNLLKIALEGFGYEAEGFEKALYQSRTRFSQITRHSPSAVNQTNAGKRAA